MFNPRENDTEIEYTCKGCDREFDVTVSGRIPARLSGPPEDCSPAEGGDPEPFECPYCGEEVDVTEACDQADDCADLLYEEWLEHQADVKRELQEHDEPQ